MRISLKLLLLLITLAGVLGAWLRARHEYDTANLRSRRNNGWTRFTYKEIPEKHAPHSELTIDDMGMLCHADVSGPAGYAAIEAHPNKQIRHLSFLTRESVARFVPDDFPNLRWLFITDGHDIDYADITLEWLDSFPRLEGLEIVAQWSDPRTMLASLPNIQRIRLYLSTSQLGMFDAFPAFESVSLLLAFHHQVTPMQS